MEFPKKKFDVTSYLAIIKNLLNDKDCAIFIDTNVISQLYRLNDKAREDFYSWVDSCEERFHVPVWVVQEYSDKVYTGKTSEYLSELSKFKKDTSEIQSLSSFVKGYVGESLMKGTEYENNAEQLKRDVDEIAKTLTKVNNAINSNLKEHQTKVYDELVSRLSKHILSTDIFSILKETEKVHSQRYANKIPPGYKDEYKENNQIGDLIIWLEILDFCKSNSITKALFISRDKKTDIVYEPEIQTVENKRSAGLAERVRIAKNSLVYEFNLNVSNGQFYIIDFKTFVKVLGAQYRELAISFQLATAEEQTIKCEKSDSFELKTESFENNKDVNNVSEGKKENKDTHPDVLYTGVALHDALYDSSKSLGCMDEYITQLKTYNWYVQNPSINKLMELSSLDFENTQENRDSFFVLGRNILQSAEGSSGSAITFMENLYSYINSWKSDFKKALVDGMLYEVFFNGDGKIRPKGFKASFFKDLVTNINKFNFIKPFEFINEQLSKVRTRFVPNVGTSDKYEFEFTINEKKETESLKCNGSDISETFKEEYASDFAYPPQIKNALMEYYAILPKQIEVSGIPNDLDIILHIWDLPF